MANESEEERTTIIIREIAAPPHVVFEAHSKPEHVKRWFGPVEWPLTKCEMDFRVGGEFHFQMTGPGGVLGEPFGGTYLEIVPDARIVMDNGFETEGAPRMTMITTLEPKGDGTLLTLRTVFESKAMHDEYLGMGFAEGTNSALDQLEDVAEGLKASV
ncbi:MAG: SRPBCC domain-containing protein [Sphingomonas sp.]|uniref:SRPBCC family protein n=1 Tax=Sphingomonas sp. TaxID=28214 RepID=UPI002273949E|nr:SRPBCC domain-containing protein [Sphingomonas sp.]MCX8477927.1 SRPBCC domain-containing protein [Sphingomonas sp.]